MYRPLASSRSMNPAAAAAAAGKPQHCSSFTNCHASKNLSLKASPAALSTASSVE
jgi:hypothetical protein